MSSLSAEFERLALADPVSTGVDMETDPADLPALHLYARSFRYLGVELGETRIEAYPTSRVSISKRWMPRRTNFLCRPVETGHLANRARGLISKSIWHPCHWGIFCNSMDISSSMEGGQTLVDFQRLVARVTSCFCPFAAERPDRMSVSWTEILPMPVQEAAACWAC